MLGFCSADVALEVNPREFTLHKPPLNANETAQFGFESIQSKTGLLFPRKKDIHVLQNDFLKK